MELRIDINCDMGESYGAYTIGNDEALMPWVTSSNIACGFHGGDPLTIQNTIELALKHNVRIGAHPAYPDLGGFGRRRMSISSAELYSLIKYQVAALKGLTENMGGILRYVKPHGALYNTCCDSMEESKTVSKAIYSIDPKLSLMGLAGSIMEKAAKEVGLEFIAEAFADRRYEPDGKLMSRTKDGSVIHTPQESSNQVKEIIQNQRVLTSDGTYHSIQADSICIHGDNSSALEILKAIDTMLLENNIQKG